MVGNCSRLGVCIWEALFSQGSFLTSSGFSLYSPHISISPAPLPTLLPPREGTVWIHCTKAELTMGNEDGAHSVP